MLNIVRRKGDLYIQDIHLNAFIEQQKRHDNQQAHVASFLALIHTKLDDTEITDLYNTAFCTNCYWTGTKAERVISIVKDDLLHSSLLRLPEFNEIISIKTDTAFLISGFSKRYVTESIYVQVHLINKKALTNCIRDYKLRNILT